MFFDLDKPLSDQRFDTWSRRIASETGLFQREDANETAIFARQLEHVYTKTYDVKYPEFKARSFIPLDASVPSGAETYTYRQFDEVGMAELIANYADDLPDVTMFGKEFTGKCKSIGNAYSYSIQDVRRASMAGMALETSLPSIARRAHEAKHDKIAAFGDTLSGLVGFLNHPNVPLVTPTTGTWSTATADQIIADLDKLVNSIVTTTNGVHVPDTLLLPITQFLRLNNLQKSAASDKTVLQWYLENNPFIKNIDHWYVLDTANAAGNGPRAVAYQRSPEVLGLVIPQEFEQFPPQAKNLAFSVPCHSRCGGVKVTYPLAIAYMDGI